jgi:predicted nucleic acid-binding protein
MDIVVDANVIFAALIKDSFSYSLLFSDRFHLFTPEYVFTEFEEHKDEILKKTERSAEDFSRVIEILKRRIAIIPLEELVPYAEEAESLTPDPDDMAYFALALRLGCAIWSNDKKLKSQDKVTIYHTAELARLL